uniref:Disease resistance protein RGA3 n=1 Tax=Cajanus cajan TaxID=3821 RepID=A0A151TGP3_CAJCA|nr:Putative disease resistance protein RGA3 [Cajanus cajan]
MQDLLQSRRYLLVLDDVWDDKQPTWQRLKSVQACGAKGASILVTTRLPTVAAVMGTMPPHELSMLSDNDCWELFKYQAFGHNEVEQVELVDIGKEIVKKCGGVPLAAKALGGLLRFKRERKEWVYVKESNLWNLPHDENSIMPALRLSYLNLPIKLGQCFAYCAIFPKDEKIRKQYLIELWMANGFISSNEILDAEEVGDGVWRELYWRSLFHDIKTDKSGKVISFQQALSTCIKMLFIALLHCEERRQLSSSIGDLKHLRYLNLSWGRFETLPESLCKLWNLLMLKLDGCRELQKLPNSSTRLMALQQLSLKDCDKLSSLPLHIRKLTSLRILTTFFVGKEKGFHLAELGALKLKGDLHIIHLERVKSVMDAQKANMSSKQLIELGLKWERNDEESELEEKGEDIVEVLQPDTQQLESLMVKGYKGANFPRWMFSSSLKQLVIKGCKEVEGLHEALRHMTALKRLELNDLPKLEFLPDCFGNLSLLRQLTIGFCDKLRCLPTSLSHSNLNSLWIYGCHPDLEKRCEKEIGEDWPKIAHIPRITVGGEGYDSD